MWERLSVTGEQWFYHIDPAGKEDFRKLDGVIEIYTYREGNQWVVVCWRVPTMYKTEVSLDTWAPRVAGSVTVR